MQLPQELQEAIEILLEDAPQTAIKNARALLTKDYKAGKVSPFNDEAKRLAYIGARMPATYAAVHKVLKQISLTGHILDLGAGPGTASWAVVDLFPNVKEITLIEQSSDAIALGKVLAKNHPTLAKANWKLGSLHEPLPQADTAILSYVLAEIDDITGPIARCWESVSTLIIVEPGTPSGYDCIIKARDQLIDLGANILGPCPHAFVCPIQKPDWCHFSARVERTRLHRHLKEGSLGYEDEKFCYIIASKSGKAEFANRIIRTPQKHSGHVKLTLCTENGTIQEPTISRKDKGLYKKARKSEWGDTI